MKIKKTLSIAIVAICILLTACNRGGNASVVTVQNGVLSMATNATFPPYEYYRQEKIVGIDVEIAEEIAKELGLKLEVQDMDFGSIITSIQTGKNDIGVAALTVTKERGKNISFSTSYATSVQVIIVPNNSKIESKDDLKGVLIGCQEGTTGFIYCLKDYGRDNVIAYTDGATAINAVTLGKVDCVVIDKQPALEFLKANKNLKILDADYITEEYSIAVKKENVELLDAINDVIDEMKADGRIQKILDKYITAK